MRRPGRDRGAGMSQGLLVGIDALLATQGALVLDLVDQGWSNLMPMPPEPHQRLVHVRVRVDEPGKEQPAATVDDLGGGVSLSRPRTNRDDATVFDHDIARRFAQWAN